MNAKPIKVDRSRIQLRKYCVQARMLGYHRGGKGIAKKGSKYDAAFGDAVHEGMKILLQSGGLVQKAIKESGYKLQQAINECFGKTMDPAVFVHFMVEQTWLHWFLIYGWWKYRYQAVLRDYEILSVEEETKVLFRPEDFLPANIAASLRPLELDLRLDILLRNKSTEGLEIKDFKTTSQASEDWNTNLDNSLQSNLYIAAADIHYHSYIEGISYEGLVKGKREIDKAKNSPFTGMEIQYNSPLYGWEKNGVLCKYVAGSRKVFVPDFLKLDLADMEGSWMMMNSHNPTGNLQEYFPSTIPYRPLDIGFVVGQTIVNENRFELDLETLERTQVGSSERVYLENVLFERTLDNCYKYGSKHPCPFVAICHNKIHEDEIKVIYEDRIPHH